MSTLKERLDRMRDGFKKDAPKESLDIMARAYRELAATDIMDRIPKVGGRLPSFRLPDTDGNLVDSDTVLADGPLVVTFYRGVW
jgi:hypothetical protein